jgi:hypothetical protein
MSFPEKLYKNARYPIKSPGRTAGDIGKGRKSMKGAMNKGVGVDNKKGSHPSIISEYEREIRK